MHLLHGEYLINNQLSTILCEFLCTFLICVYTVFAGKGYAFGQALSLPSCIPEYVFQISDLIQLFKIQILLCNHQCLNVWKPLFVFQVFNLERPFDYTALTLL